MSFGSFSEIGSDESLAEINMVPFIDVMLVLLVIFIVTAPLLSHSVKLGRCIGTAWWSRRPSCQRSCRPQPVCNRSPNCTSMPSAAPRMKKWPKSCQPPRARD